MSYHIGNKIKLFQNNHLKHGHDLEFFTNYYITFAR